MKMKPIQIDPAKKEDIAASLATQEPTRGVPKTFDQNYPVFRPPYGERALVYVPNHVVEVDGALQLRMDVSHVHDVVNRNRNERIRCVSGLETLGYDFCPLDDVSSLAYELANAKAEHEMNIRNINPNEDSAERRSVRRKHYGDMSVGKARLFYTFPIIVIESTGKYKPVWNNETNAFNATPQWVVLSETQYEKWVNALENADEEYQTLGGLFLKLDYTVGVKEGMTDRDRNMTAARNMGVGVLSSTVSLDTALKKKGTSLEEVTKEWDTLTQEWDAVKSATTVVQNALFAPEDLAELAESLKNTISAQLLQVGSSAAQSVGSVPEVAPVQADEPLGVLPEGSIDLD